MPVLHHITDDPQLPWQWWAPGATVVDLAYADAWYLRRAGAECYVAGFRDRAAAERYGRANRWRVE